MSPRFTQEGDGWRDEGLYHENYRTAECIGSDWEWSSQQEYPSITIDAWNRSPRCIALVDG